MESLKLLLEGREVLSGPPTAPRKEMEWGRSLVDHLSDFMM